MRTPFVLLGLAVLAALCGCGDDGEVAEGAGGAPVSYEIVVSEPRFVVPSAGLPPETPPFSSNNNVDIIRSDGRLFMAWRSAPTHFASPDTRMYVVSSADGGNTWSFEHTISIGNDVREPRFLDYAGYLQLMFFEAGRNPGAFEPMRLLRIRRLGPARWSEIEVLTDAGEVPWDVKVHDGVAYRTSYQGKHYGSGDTSEIAVFFKSSADGSTWRNVGTRPFVYYGGVSEVAFDFDTDGSLYAVTRNEDGDASGFGSHVCHAPAGALGEWECPAQSDPNRYDSPEMFRHESDLFLVARRDVGGPYDRGDTHLSLSERRSRYLIDYSLRPKRTALYRIDETARTVVHLRDLPGAGDTAFPAVVQTAPHSYLLANYTSPLDDPDISWLRGQTSARGTQIYLLQIDFVPYTGPTHTPTATPLPAITPTATPREGEEDVALELTPVFAAPGRALAIAWPERAFGLIDLGDGTRVGPDIASHDYSQTSRIYPVQGTLEIAGARRDVRGAVARTAVRAAMPLGGFLLAEPGEPVVQQVIRGVIPAFYFAFDGTTLAVASDTSGQATFGFEDVHLAAVAPAPGGGLDSEPIDFAIELLGAAGQSSGQSVGLVNATFHWKVQGETFASPAAMEAELVTADVVALVVELAELDPVVATQFLAGLFGFDPAHPPETLPVRANLTVQLLD